jgi:hypothetical protein
MRPLGSEPRPGEAEDIVDALGRALFSRPSDGVTPRMVMA